MSPRLLVPVVVAGLSSACRLLAPAVACVSDENCKLGQTCVGSVCVEDAPTGGVGAALHDGGVARDAAGDVDSGAARDEDAGALVDGGPLPSDGGPLPGEGGPLQGGGPAGDGGDDAGADADETPWLDGFAARHPLVVAAALAGAPLVDFPLLVDVVDPGLALTSSGGAVQSGADLSAATSAAEPLPLDVEQYDGATGALRAWVRAPLVEPGVATTLWLYAGAAAPPAPPAPADVWRSGYRGVWHLDELTGGGGPSLDESGNGNDAACISMEDEDVVDGAIGLGTRFNTDNEGLSITSSSLDLAADLTVVAWGRLDGPASGGGRIYHRGDELSRAVNVWLEDETAALGTFGLAVNVDGGGAGMASVEWQIPGFAYGAWHHLAAVVDQGAARLVLYVDGARVAETSYSGALASSTQHHLGNWGFSSLNRRRFNGVLDEVSVAAAARSDAWIAASYQNQLDPAGTVSLGAQQAR